MVIDLTCANQILELFESSKGPVLKSLRSHIDFSEQIVELARAPPGIPLAFKIRQTFADFEVIIVDDASPDGCWRIAESYAARDRRVRVIRHEINRGVSGAFNTGFNAARGRYFTRLAQDDVFAEEALGVLVEYLRRQRS